ncbi:SusC/RagA family TonB-linked outer membrane protein [Christiangramia forsetii]|uniref:TonB-dependent outer membrane receptor n=2 Tax=Christiangramia forsetii TaxID=411153 RepID=A0M5H4_CHRFK|nr:SusC/RagA family TonB-linked outer membrane protein [Christiangramia forsetii]GGG32933.1 SusC/RagA family TonB-linked outer membrane protein [Christiangramia forsetii]CAL67869.1 TonB-dependent outer membrane receptor [Christiangramia forsetii KT0803]
MKRKLHGFLTLLLVLVVQIGFAQDKTVSGTVTDDEGLPLPGATVVVEGTSTGVQTDFDGKYEIVATEGSTLNFSFVGFTSQSVPVGAQNVINVTLDVDQGALEEVVVLGYRTSTKEKSSVSSVTVTAETIENRPNASFVQTLSGQVAGLNISTSSGQPGANSTVNLRGINSINGNTEPLFIIDGAPVDEDNFRSLNPQDIASISVLKDAGATAIYGNRGANGVVIVETRRGSFNSPLKINYTGILGVNTLQDNDYDLMSSQEQLRLEQRYGNGRGTGLTDEEIAAAETTDWANYFFRDALTKSHTLNLSSGGAKTTQFTSLGYSEIEGILRNSDLQRFNVRSNVSGRSENDKFNYGLNLSVNYSENNEPNSIGTGGINQNYILGAYQSVPYISPDDYTNGADLTSPLSFTNTPLFLIDKLRTFTRLEEEVKVIGSFNASYEIFDDLTAGIVASADYNSEFLTNATAPDSFNGLLFGGAANPTAGDQSQQTTRVFSFNNVTSLNYDKEIGDHTFGVGAYLEYFKAHLRTFGYTAEGLDPKTFSPGDGSGFVDDNSENDFFVDQANANILNAGLFSYFGTLDWDYDGRYGLSGSVRRDASYRFSESNRFATFWSIAGRWNIHNEAFMSGSVFDVLKLRGSYGTAGNQRITGTTYFSGPDLTRNFFATGSGYGGQNSIFLSQIANTTLKWETVTSSNIGLDFELFQSRLRGSVDAYYKETEDLFQSTPVSAINAITSINANVGSLSNKGVDLTLNYDVVRSLEEGGFNMRVNLVGNYNETEILDLPSDDGEIIGIGREGGKLFEYYTIEYAGVNPANGNALFYTADGEVTENPNADTDRVWLDKNIYPDFTGSFGLNMDYKGFFLQTQFNYVIGVDRYDFDLSGFQDPTSIGQFRSSNDLQRAWTPDNRVTDIPALRATNIGVYESTRYLVDADYLRVRFATIGYSLPKTSLDQMGLTALRVFLQGENLATFSEWRGFDAEAQDNTSRIYPTPRTISLGLEIGL